MYPHKRKLCKICFMHVTFLWTTVPLPQKLKWSQFPERFRTDSSWDRWYFALMFTWMFHPEFDVVYALVILKVINSEIVLFRFAFILWTTVIALRTKICLSFLDATAPPLGASIIMAVLNRSSGLLGSAGPCANLHPTAWCFIQIALKVCLCLHPLVDCWHMVCLQSA